MWCCHVLVTITLPFASRRDKALPVAVEQLPTARGPWCCKPDLGRLQKPLAEGGWPACRRAAITWPLQQALHTCTPARLHTLRWLPTLCCSFPPRPLAGPPAPLPSAASTPRASAVPRQLLLVLVPILCPRFAFLDDSTAASSSPPSVLNDLPILLSHTLKRCPATTHSNASPGASDIQSQASTAL